MLKRDFDELQEKYVHAIDEINILKEKLRQKSLDIESIIDGELAECHKENKELILEVKESHNTIDDLRERIDVLYEQINRLT